MYVDDVISEAESARSAHCLRATKCS